MRRSQRNDWEISEPVFSPGAPGTWDSVAVKDPSIVFFHKKWHMVYTARGQNGSGEETYSIGYVSAPSIESLNTAPRYSLKNLHQGTRYAAAPHIFYFKPQNKWFLIAQADYGSRYTPIYSTTSDIDDPTSWSDAQILVEKHEKGKWIDFWVICDENTAFLIYTRNPRKMYYMTTPLEIFPRGFSNPTPFSGKIKVHEACMVYKIRDRPEYVLVTETKHPRKLREFYISHATDLRGPWSRSTLFASIKNSRFTNPQHNWTRMFSHGEFLRAGYDQYMEIPPLDRVDFLIQGTDNYSDAGYASLLWELGLIRNYSK